MCGRGCLWISQSVSRDILILMLHHTSMCMSFELQLCKNNLIPPETIVGCTEWEREQMSSAESRKGFEFVSSKVQCVWNLINFLRWIFKTAFSSLVSFEQWHCKRISCWQIFLLFFCFLVFYGWRFAKADMLIYSFEQSVSNLAQNRDQISTVYVYFIY